MRFLEWLPTAKRGDAFAYFSGDLAWQRNEARRVAGGGSEIAPDLRIALDDANDAWRAHEYGDCTLVQKRRGVSCWDYLAVKS